MREGTKHSEETRLKISNATKIAMANLSPEKRAKLSPKGEHRSPATEFKKGHTLSINRKEDQRRIAIEKGFGKWMKNKIPKFIIDGSHNHPSGEKHPFWKGGITPERIKIRASKEYSEWRKKVFMRDYYTCRHCNKETHGVVAHHIKSFANFPELRFDIENGLTLCKNCHKEEHKKLKNSDVDL